MSEKQKQQMFNNSFLDIDECNATPSPCDVNALCTDTTGSFTCTCNTGFTGDGFTCAGIQNWHKT